MICWGSNSIETPILNEISQRKADDWWFSAMMHELGHLFEIPMREIGRSGRNFWSWNGEDWATYLAWLSIEKLGGNIFENGGLVKPLTFHWRRLRDRISANPSPDLFQSGSQGDYIVLLLGPIIGATASGVLRFEEGWQILKNVFHSYHNHSLTALNHTGNPQQIMLQDFIERCERLLGFSIRNEGHWLSRVVEIYERSIELPSEPFCNVFPLFPKVGDEIHFSMFNFPPNRNYWAFFEADGARIGEIPFTGNNNFGVRFTLQHSHIGQRFRVRITDLSPQINVLSLNTTTPVRHR